MRFRKRIFGLFTFAFGLGLLLGLLLKGPAVIIAAVLIIVGFWLLFM